MFAMGIQWRYGQTSGVDVSLANAYLPKKGYSGIDMKKYHDKYLEAKKQGAPFDELVYIPMTDPFQVFDFDFNQKNLSVEGKTSLSVPTINSGFLTSFVFWFDLELVPGVELSSSPFETDPNRKV